MKVLLTLSQNYKYNYSKKILHKYRNFKNFTVVGIGGSILGVKAIYQFLNHKINKNFFFVDNLEPKLDLQKKIFVNLIISKSGNTLETISNLNLTRELDLLSNHPNLNYMFLPINVSPKRL